MNRTRQHRGPDGRKATVLILGVALLTAFAVSVAWPEGSPTPAASRVIAGLHPPDSGAEQQSAQVREIVADDTRRSTTATEVTHAHGQVIDLAGDAVASVRVVDSAALDGPAIATSDASGSFLLPDVLAGDRVAVRDPRWTTVQSGQVRTGASCTIVVAPRIELSGAVLDATGQPIAGALLSITASDDGATAQPATAGRTWLSLSEQDGTFVFAGAPAMAGARLRTQYPGKQSDERELLPRSSSNLIVRLEDAPVVEPLLGTVFGPDGNPVANATVRAGATATVTAADGTFALAVPAHEASDTPLLVYAQGLQPTTLGDWRGPDGRPGPELTVLLQPPQSIAGRIVDAGGRACPDWFVTLGDPTPLDANRPNDACVENVLGAARVLTDATGAFRFESVLARPYVLEAWSHDGSAAIRSDIVSPGTDNLVLTAIACEPATLRGRVVTTAGQPVAGAIVGEQRPNCASAPGNNAMRFDTRVITDADGRFELPVRGGLHLIVDGQGLVPVRVPLASPIEDLPLLVRVPARKAVHVEAGGAIDSLSLTALDGGRRTLRSCDRYGSCSDLFFAGAGDGDRGLPANANAVILSHRGVALGQLSMPARGDDMALWLSDSLSRLLQSQ